MSLNTRQKLRSYLASDTDFRAVYDNTRKRFEAAAHLTAHNWEHAYRDTINAIMIGEAEGADMSIVLPAIIMHDIGFLYGAASHQHGAVGADKVAEYLREGNIALEPSRLKHISDCIRTHKGNIHGEVPQTLEAKVVSDADVLDKLGPVGVYQVTRAWTEFNAPFAKTVEMIGLQNRQLQTPTGNKLAEPLRPFNQQFAKVLREAYEPYIEDQS